MSRNKKSRYLGVYNQINMGSIIVVLNRIKAYLVLLTYTSIEHVPRWESGESGIRTHGTHNAHTLSKRAPSATRTPLQLFLFSNLQ